MDKGMNHKGMDHKGMGHRVSLGRVGGPARQRGAVLVLVTVGMLAIIGMAGLALQSGHLFVNKTHLQNALDAAALSAAKTLNNDGTVVQAKAAGLDAFNKHLGSSTFVQREMQTAGVTPTFEFSATLDPFTPGATETDDPPATFVRASAADFTMDTWLANVLPGVGDQQSIGGTAVAGPVPIDPANTCDVLPLLMCPPTPTDPDKDCSDSRCFGWPGGDKEVCLKESSGSGSSACPNAMQKGNFHLLRLGSDISEALAGGHTGCVTVGETVRTKPGNMASTRKALDTRFGAYQGNMRREDYPPDTVTTQAPGPAGACTGFCYDQYVDRQHNGPYDNPPPPPAANDGVPGRRKVAVPIGDCRNLGGGNENIPVIGIGCFFLTRKTSSEEMYGQLIGNCQADGPVATTPPPAGSLLHKIVLYKDPNSRDS